MIIKNCMTFRFSHFYSMLIMWSSYQCTFFIHLCMKMKTKHELQLLHSAHKRLSVSHMPVHVIDFPITITKFSITLPITSYVAILNYNYHYHYFSKVINCNWLQLQITITTSLLCTGVNIINYNHMLAFMTHTHTVVILPVLGV